MESSQNRFPGEATALSGEATALWMSRLEPEQPASAQSAELAALIERAVAGESSAFEQILIRTQRRVLNLAWKLLGSLTEAQDAAQEVFLRAYKYLHRFDVRKPFEPWLIQITVNVCRDMMRKRQQSKTVFAEPEYAPEPSEVTTAGDPHTVLAAEQQKAILWKALSGLPQKERSALVLRDIEGLSTAEVAAILQSSEATVRSQISNARLKIRKALKGVQP
jgi:RNA polymerase sigma-70 factor (ECF subfamily)